MDYFNFSNNRPTPQLTYFHDDNTVASSNFDNIINNNNMNIQRTPPEEIYTNCYDKYKYEYTDNLDFSIRSDDMSEEIDDLLNNFDTHLKKRNDVLSTSVYSDILNELGKN